MHRSKRRAQLRGLFDHLVGAQQKRFGDGQPERLGGPEIDDKVKTWSAAQWADQKVWSLVKSYERRVRRA